MSNQAGKGDKSRVANKQNYAANFDKIKFPSKPKIYKFREDRAILVGDTHSLSVLYEILNTKIPNRSDVVFLGDGGESFGLKEVAIENTLSYFETINKLCQDIDIHLYHIRGNHSAPYPEIWDSQWSNIHLIKDSAYGIFPNGKKVLFVGGGVSVDRYVRKENFNYWKDEITPYLKNVEKCDVMFSHDCPEHFNHPTETLPRHFGWYVDRDITLMDDSLAQRRNMTDIAKKSEVKEIYNGHFHRTILEEIEGVTCRCLDINELYEYDATK